MERSWGFPVLCLVLEGRACDHSGRAGFNKGGWHTKTEEDRIKRVKVITVNKSNAIGGDHNVQEKGKPESQGFKWSKKRQTTWQVAVFWIVKLIRGRLWLMWFAWKKRNTLIAVIKLVCFPARQQFNIQQGVSACVWMDDTTLNTYESLLCQDNC